MMRLSESSSSEMNAFDISYAGRIQRHRHRQIYVLDVCSTARLIKWATEMVQGVEFIHTKGIRHSDLMLDQWLLDDELHARLSDFNSSGHDAYSALSLPRGQSVGLENPSHFMPRDYEEDSSVRPDLFALRSALYELEHGSAPLADEDDDTITERFRL